MDDLKEYIEKIKPWSTETFGPGPHTKGVIAHIKEECDEVLLEPYDLTEWVDIIILAIDGYWRHGGKPEDLLKDLHAKADINIARKWNPVISEDQPVHHVKETT